MNRLFTNEDCMDLMARYPDKHFDLALVDPPYGIGASKPSIKPNICRQKNGNMLNVKSNTHTHKEWDNETPKTDYYAELVRVSKNQIIWGVPYINIIAKSGLIIWDKINGESDQMDAEIAFNSFNKRVDIVRFMWSGMIQGVYCGKDINKAKLQQGNKKLNEKRIHPTQKPVALYKWLLKNYAKEGDLILDTHVGSASSLIACEEMGFDYVGCELDSDYFEMACKRIDTYRQQLKLF